MTKLEESKLMEEQLAARRAAIAKIGDETLTKVAREDIRYLEQKLIRARARFGMGED